MLSVPTTLFLFLFRPSTHPTAHPDNHPNPTPSNSAPGLRALRVFAGLIYLPLNARAKRRRQTFRRRQSSITLKFFQPSHTSVSAYHLKKLFIFFFFLSLSLSHTFRRAGVELGRFQVSSAQRVNEGMIRLTAYQLYMRRICDLLSTCVNKCRKCKTMFMSPESASKTNMQAKRERKKQGRPCIEFVHLPHLFSDCHRSHIAQK